MEILLFVSGLLFTAYSLGSFVYCWLTHQHTIHHSKSYSPFITNFWNFFIWYLSIWNLVFPQYIHLHYPVS
jgi:hypothetical protein